MTSAYKVIPNPPRGRAITPWAWAALTDVARESAIALWTDHRLTLHMAGQSPKGKWTAWLVDEGARPQRVSVRVEGYDAEDTAYRAIRGALTAWREADGG